MYERQDGVGLEIGSYAHRSILHDPEEIPSIEEAALSPTEFPFTQADFDPQMEDALELMPEIVGDESVGVKYAINGLISLTPDGMPILGETPEVKGLWSAARRVGQGGPGRRQVGGRVDGARRVAHRPALLRHQPLPRPPEDPRAREGAHVRGVPEDVRDRPPGRAVVERPRPPLSPMHEREQALGAVFYEAVGWERPQWYEAQRAARRAVRRRAARGRVGRALVVADHQRRAPRDARGAPGIFDLSAFAIFDVAGAGALDALQRVVLRADGRPRRPRRLHAGALARAAASSPTSRSCGSATTTSASSPAARTAWPTASGSATTCRPTAGARRPDDRVDDDRPLGPARPRHPLERSRADDVSHEGFPFGTCRTIEIGSQLVLASRISYVGDLGWELYVPMEQGARLWDVLWEAGQPHGAHRLRHRRLRHDRPAREGLPRLRRRARDRVHRRRGRHAAAEGQGAGLRRQGGAPAPPRGGAGRHALHAHRRRPHLGERREALPARPRADHARATARRSPTRRAAART